ncbi:3-isopropylmalate dehydratase small subunit [Streptomyces sp. ok210]|jgi:3-isopropylmalate/(R)-2-methylmalate dehydratase small subunit|uniref:3-isopropylmalate dehydratase small subunit n=1 Tax=Streptomyces sp. ok210 TaxID=1761905 RepID=UPI0008E4AB5E|nr:3-isopropylmalate dehydratase small subunit [Streptomyces sp. ok210]SFT31368.1 3-isopropylmalate dehydratase, small subunit [Streptomyces sp. ok210]
MEPLIGVTGRGVPLDRPNVDTDQIIPAAWLKNTTRTGYVDGLFEQWRLDSDFILNRPERVGASVLVTGPNFGCGSSREHAPWALHEWGFRAVIAPGFADIFRNNMPNAGLVPVWCEPPVVAALMAATTADAGAEISVDVAKRTVTCEAAGIRAAPFRLDDDARDRLVAGLTQLEVTMRAADQIAAYERARSSWLDVSV